jgi:hypothetical protein
VLGIGTEYVNLLRIALVTAWFSMLAEIGYSYLRMCYLSRVFLTITVTHVVCAVALNLLFVVVFHWGIWGILISTMILVRRRRAAQFYCSGGSQGPECHH